MRTLLTDRRLFRQNLVLNPRISTGTAEGIVEYWGSDVNIEPVPSDGPTGAPR